MENLRLKEGEIFYPIEIKESSIRELLEIIMNHPVTSFESKNEELNKLNKLYSHPAETLKWHSLKENGDEHKAKQRQIFYDMQILIQVTVWNMRKKDEILETFFAEIYEAYPDFQNRIESLENIIKMFIDVNGSAQRGKIANHFWNLANEVIKGMEISPIQVIESRMVYPRLAGLPIEYSLKFRSQWLEDMDSNSDKYVPETVAMIKNQLDEALGFLRETFPNEMESAAV